MRKPSYLGYVIGGTTALALLAGCSGGGSLAPASSSLGGGGSTTQSVASRSIKSVNYSVLPASRQSLIKPGVAVKPFVNVAAVSAPMGNQVIISDFNNSAITVFGGGGQVNATLTTGVLNPQGMQADGHGTLYVADTGNQNILIYPMPYSAPATTLSDTGNYPTDVSYDPTNGEVAAMNIFANSGSGSVTIYAKGSTTPCAQVGSSTFANVYFGAFDKSGNIYVDGHDVNGNTIVGEVTGGCSATTITTLTTSNFITFPGGVQVLKNGDIAIDDQSGGAIYTYLPPSGGSLGSPVVTTPVTGASDPVTFSMKAGDQNFWTADAGLLNANRYPYPAGGAPFKTFTNNFSLPIGTAVNPAQVL